MKSGARGPDSEVVIGDGVAWTLHRTTVGYVCAWCGDACPPGADYWVCHGAEIGRLCPWCFHLVYDPTPPPSPTDEQWRALRANRRRRLRGASTGERPPLWRDGETNVPPYPRDGYYSGRGPSPTWLGLAPPEATP